MAALRSFLPEINWGPKKSHGLLKSNSEVGSSAKIKTRAGCLNLAFILYAPIWKINFI